MKAYCSIRVTAHMAVLNDRVEPLPSLELVRAMWNRHRQAWEASESCRHLREILRGIAMTGKVSRLVGFALGDITAEDLEGRAPVRSAMQHAFLLTLQDILRERQHVSQLPCYAQDIAYNETDKTILAESGCTVLDDPQGFVEVDDESVVVSLYPNCPVKEIIHDLAKPAVIIWDAERDDRGTKPE